MNHASIFIPAMAGFGLVAYALSAQVGEWGAGETLVVTVPQRATEPATHTPVAAQTPAKVLPAPGDRGALARELQRELQRVGCYGGDINGAWTTSTRMAMKAFTDRVNATLPIEAPDLILLSLVQRHQGKACGTDCPSGQSQIEDGRCVPSAVLAKAGKPESKPVETTASAGASWAPTSGIAPEARSPAIKGSAALVDPEARTGAKVEGKSTLQAGAEPMPTPRQSSRSRIAAAEPEAEGLPEAGPREKRSARSGRPVPEAGVYDGRERHRIRRAKSKPPKFVRKFLRSMNRSFAGLPW